MEFWIIAGESQYFHFIQILSDKPLGQTRRLLQNLSKETYSGIKEENESEKASKLRIPNKVNKSC